MRNDGFYFDERYSDIGRKVFDMIHQIKLPHEPPFVLSIAGESGCGKTVLAHALRPLFENSSYQVLVMSQDDYFHLPPLFNHHTRLADISWVGVDEVNLLLLNKHIRDFRKRQIIYKPEIDYEANIKSYEPIDTMDYDLLIVEGTYVSTLQEIDCRIFFIATYQETEKNRLQRGRDKIDNFTHRILPVESSIISSHIQMADIVIDKDYEVSFSTHC